MIPKPEKQEWDILLPEDILSRYRAVYKNLPSGQLLTGGQKTTPSGRTLTGGNVKLLPTGRDFPLFVYGSLSDVANNANFAYASDDTNTIGYQTDQLCTDPVTGDRYLVWYRSTGSLICVAKQTGGVGAWVTTVGTATAVAITDDHLVISATVDATSRLNVAWGFHSDQMNYWRAPNPGDTLITDATKLVSPVGAGPGPGLGLVSGNAAFESAASYPQFKAYTDGQIAYLWRQGGSGLGNLALYNINGTTITSVNLAIFDGITDGCSPYLFQPFIEWSNSKTPNRLWVAFQIRDSASPLTAHDIYCVYSDDRGVTWKSFNGTPMTLPMRRGNVGAALVANIPVGTPNYTPMQGMTVSLDGEPIMATYFGTVGVDFNVHIYKALASGTVIHSQTNFNQATFAGMSRPAVFARQGQVIALYSKTTTVDNIGRLTAFVASGATLGDIYEQTVTYVNGWNNVGDSGVVWDARKWQTSGILQLINIRTRIGVSIPANGPSVFTVTISEAGPPAVQTPLQTMGSLDYWFDASNYVSGTWVDLSGNSRTASQGTAASQPSFLANAINGLPVVRGDGSNDALGIAYLRVAPGTKPFYFAAVMRTVTWTINRQWYNDGGGGAFFNPGSPANRILNGGSNLQVNMTVGAFKFVQFQLTNSTSDFFQIAELFGTGINAGNTAGGGTTFLFGTSLAGANSAAVDYAELWSYAGTPPTYDQRGKFVRYVINKFGESVMQ